MNRFDPSTPRATFGIAAIAMTALTIGLLVVIPTKMNSGDVDTIPLATANPLPPSATQVTISPARIDVVGVREANVAAQSRNTAAKRKQQS